MKRRDLIKNTAILGAAQPIENDEEFQRLLGNIE